MVRQIESNVPANWQRGPSPEWEIHFDTALKRARSEHKRIFVLSTGSDWCGWCMKLKKDVLMTPEFRQFARKHLVLLYLDSPQRNPLPEDQNQHNRDVRRRLRFGGGVPSAIVLDESGNPEALRSGYSPLPVYMEFLNSVLRGNYPEMVAREKKQREEEAQRLQELARQCRFRIVAWGTSNRQIDRPLSEDLGTVPLNTAVYFRVHYDLPSGTKTRIWLHPSGTGSRGARSSTSPSALFRGRGETVQSIRYRGGEYLCKNLRISIQPEGASRSVTALEIPCRIEWKNGASAPDSKPADDQTGAGWIRNRNTRTTVQHRNGSVRLVNQKRSAPGPVEPGKDPLENLNLPPMSSRWQRGISGWEVHYPTALTKARQENKMIFALNTGSDWCGWCMKLRKEVLQSSEFKRFARRHLILLYLDSPKKNPLPSDQKQHNMLVRQKLGFGGGVPSAVIVNADGQVVARKGGYSQLPAYMAFLKQQVK